jgi:hypothetical protein
VDWQPLIIGGVGIASGACWFESEADCCFRPAASRGGADRACFQFLGDHVSALVFVQIRSGPLTCGSTQLRSIEGRWRST